MMLKDFNTDNRILPVTRLSWGDDSHVWIFSNRKITSFREDSEEKSIRDERGHLMEITVDDMCSDDWIQKVVNSII